MLEVAEKFCLEIKATEQNFPVVLFIILCKIGLTFEFVNEIVRCDHSNEKKTEQDFPVEAQYRDTVHNRGKIT